MRKKILIITDNTREQINGVVTTFANIELLAQRDGFDIDYISPVLFNSIPSPGYPEVRLAWPRKIGRIIESQHPDYVHIATEGPIGLAARLWLDAKGWKYNTSYHTKFPEFLNTMYHVPPSITYTYLRWFHKHSGRVLTTTETMVQDLKNHGFQGDIKSWTRGVNRDVFNPALRNRIGNELRLLSVGRVSKEKNLDAFCELDISNCHKTVVGDGPYRRELERRYPAVNFVGAKKGRELAQFYADADVFVFTSRSDTFGVVIIESLACGTPVAAYPVPGPMDIIQPGITGYLSDCLESAVMDCQKLHRDQIVKASMTWTWQSCWQIFRQNLIQVRNHH